MQIKDKLGDDLHKSEGMFITYNMNENSPMSMLGETKGGEIMNELEALCNKNADTIFDIQYDDGLPVGVFEYEVLLTGIKNSKEKNG